MLKFTKRGFTLIELMVVIGIIAILAAAGFVALGSTRPKARDSRRREDIAAIANAMEIFYNNQVIPAYPAADWDSTDVIDLDPSAAVVNNFVVPTDPSNGVPAAQVYSITNAATAFCACARLEAAVGGNSSSVCNATFTYTAANNGPFFCKTSLQ